jgi:hypothetical protein
LIFRFDLKAELTRIRIRCRAAKSPTPSRERHAGLSRQIPERAVAQMQGEGFGREIGLTSVPSESQPTATNAFSAKPGVDELPGLH